MNPVYCKYSNDRAKEFRIKTAIFQGEDGKKVVRKSALNPAAENHVDRLYRHYLQMEESFRDSPFTPNKCTRTKEGVELEFVEGETLEQYLDRLYLSGSYLEIVEEMKKYRDVLYSLSDNVPFRYTEKFEEVFGEDTRFDDCRSLSISNIDLIFCNLLMGEKWTVIDYEWVLDVPVPIEFIVYRAIHYYLYSNTKRKALLDFHVYRLLGISDEKVETYAQMEKNFQKYVAGSKSTMPQLKGHMLKRCEDAQALLRDQREDWVQLYMDDGTGFSEENSVKKGYCRWSGIVMLETELKEEVKGIRLDPAVSAVMIKNLSVLGDGKKIEPVKSSGLQLEDGAYMFAGDDPQIIFSFPEGTRHVAVRYSVVEFLETWRADVLQLAQKGQELQRENENLRSLNETLAAGKEQAEQYIARLHGKWFWRMFSKGKRMLKK